MQQNVQQRLFGKDSTVVLNQPEFSKAVHEKADLRPSSTDDVSQRLLGFRGISI